MFYLDLPNGLGWMIWPDSSQFSGTFKNGKANGEGLFLDKRGVERKALFKNDKKVKFLD